jgi:hypothetical protein
LLLLWALAAQLTISAFAVYVQANSRRYAQLPFVVSEYTSRIQHVTHGYEHSGLRAGDQILALNGHPVVATNQMDELQFEWKPGDTLPVTVERQFGGQRRTLNIPVRMQPDSMHALSWAIVLSLWVFLPLICIAVGFYIALARPYDPLAWITMALLASFTQLVSTGSYGAIWSPWREIVLFTIRSSIVSGRCGWCYLGSFSQPLFRSCEEGVGSRGRLLRHSLCWPFSDFTPIWWG